MGTPGMHGRQVKSPHSPNLKQRQRQHQRLPSWLPAVPAWDIQPWEAPPAGGGPPPEPLVYRSHAQKYPPSIATGQYFPLAAAHQYPQPHSPYMPGFASSLPAHPGAFFCSFVCSILTRMIIIVSHLHFLFLTSLCFCPCIRIHSKPFL